MSTRFHLAQVNIGRFRAPIDDHGRHSGVDRIRVLAGLVEAAVPPYTLIDKSVDRNIGPIHPLR